MTVSLTDTCSASCTSLQLVVRKLSQCSALMGATVSSLVGDADDNREPGAEGEDRADLDTTGGVWPPLWRHVQPHTRAIAARCLQHCCACNPATVSIPNSTSMTSSGKGSVAAAPLRALARSIDDSTPCALQGLVPLVHTARPQSI